MQSSIFPFDVLIDIFHKLDDDVRADHHALKACALVCRALVPSCQKRIFYKLTLEDFHHSDPPITTRSSLKLLDTLSSNPKIGSYVRELELTELQCPGGFFPPPESETINTTSREITALILNRLTCLWRLAIFGYMWPMFSEVKDSLYAIARSATLTHLHIECAQSIPRSFFLNFVNIKHLSLTTSDSNDGGSIAPGESDPTIVEHGLNQGSSSSCPQVDSLKLWNTVHGLSFHIFSSLLTASPGQSSFDITHLRELRTAYVPRQDFEEVSMICGVSLRYLTIRYTDSVYSRSKPTNFAHLTSLVTLTLICNEYHASWKVIRLMETLPSPSLLEELTIVFRADVKYRGELVGQEFTALDRFLSRYAKHLENLTLYCISDEDVDECRSGFQIYLREKLEKQMPNLSRMGVINVDICNSDYFGYQAFCY